MNRIIITTLLLAFLFHPLSASSDTLIFGVPDYPPNSYSTADAFLGFDVEIIRQVGKELNINIRYMPCNWIRCVKLFRSGKVDMLGSFNESDDRKVFASYVGPAYTPGRIVFVVPTVNARKISSYEDLSELVVGYEASARLFRRFDEDSNLKKYAATSIETLFKLLASGRVDTVAYNDMAVFSALQRPEYAGRFEIAEFQTGNDGYFVISRQSAFLEQHDAIDLKLRELFNRGFVLSAIRSYTDVHPGSP